MGRRDKRFWEKNGDFRQRQTITPTIGTKASKHGKHNDALGGEEEEEMGLKRILPHNHQFPQPQRRKSWKLQDLVLEWTKGHSGSGGSDKLGGEKADLQNGTDGALEQAKAIEKGKIVAGGKE